MNRDDFKKLLDEALDPIKQKQDEQSDKLDNHSADLVNITDKLDNHSAALISIESKLDAYGDMYKINNDNVRKVEKRLEILEKNADIAPLPEFILSNEKPQMLIRG